jgi:hypothetical protein
LKKARGSEDGLGANMPGDAGVEIGGKGEYTTREELRQKRAEEAEVRAMKLGAADVRSREQSQPMADRPRPPGELGSLRRRGGWHTLRRRRRWRR